MTYVRWYLNKINNTVHVKFIIKLRMEDNHMLFDII